MSIHVAITHRTSYRFDRNITLHPHQLRLRPAPHTRTPILAYDLTISPREHFINWQQDPFGNWVARLVFPERSDHLIVNVDLIADLATINPFDFFVEEAAREWPFDYDAQTARDLGPYLEPATPDTPELTAWLARHATPDALNGRAVIDVLVALNQAMSQDIAYTVRMEPGVQTPTETLDRAIGSCRDTAWLLIEAIRRLGLAARFASGYLVQLKPDQPGLDGPDGPEADFTDLHAWAEVYVPGAGWIGLDPTSGLLAGEGHIPLACTPHPVSASPITGATDVAEVTFDFKNEVRRISEPPRVTLPYRDDQWKRIDALGQLVDERLDAGDVRLTMGGEPTFVSVDDMEGDEWNTAADGSAKRDRAEVLARSLADALAEGPLIRHGQGKQYPGEPLPRWEIDLTWRRDGVPIWSRPELLADPETEGSHELADAHALLAGVARRFGLGDDVLLAAHPDVAQRALDEARSPSDDPLDGGAASLGALDPDAAADDRAAAVAALDRPEGEPTGWVLPLHPNELGTTWMSARWKLRRGHVYLLAGDSPIGLRLPLDSLTHSEHPPTFEKSRFAPADDLPAHPRTLIGDAERCEAHEVPPTAVTAEIRNGHVEVFLPPFPELEHGLALVAAIEDVAAELDASVVLVGYPLAGDDRVRRLSVTPDPGVVEVNVVPSENWGELTEVVNTVYSCAREARLGTEKFAIDGTHTGTGGGNHVTIGGPTPADSPMLRRPDLLRSLVTFWQRHPSLSYLFSGQFIGPTSQAPRVDEGRIGALDDLEIAFGELDRLVDQDEEPSPWMVDRLLRHLLVDLTGNTHRAEFCIDKLFSPDVGGRRLGIVELRAFEMPPHPQMALVQALLVRTLVATFWEAPLRQPPIRWGRELHDRFLLPWFVERDLDTVVDHVRRHGFEFERAWLDPFVEFRFPVLGETTIGETRIKLRRAIEPWLVLGEEVGSQGTARYVDSSVERLQVTASLLDQDRHVLVCNGVPLELQPTDDPAVGCAGVRYKAWQPWSAMHPTIGVHVPLRFEIIDRVVGRSLGGCTYRVAHPGGRNYTTFPVNAAEAETRRRERFEPFGHTPGSVDVEAIDRRLAQVRRSALHPLTVDLRHFPEAVAETRDAASLTDD